MAGLGASHDRRRHRLPRGRVRRRHRRCHRARCAATGRQGAARRAWRHRAAKRTSPGSREAASRCGVRLVFLPRRPSSKRQRRRADAVRRVARAPACRPSRGGGAGGGRARLRALRAARSRRGATCALASDGDTAMTVHFIGAGPGARRSHHAARPRSHRALPRLPLCRLARAARAARPLPARRAHRRHGAALSRRDRGRVRARARARAATWRGFIRAIFRSGARSASSSAVSTRAAFPTRVTPGVPAFAAAAAALGRELTLPEVAQSRGADAHAPAAPRAMPPARDARERSPRPARRLRSTSSIHALARRRRAHARSTAPIARSPSSPAPAGPTSGSCAQRSATIVGAGRRRSPSSARR